MRHWKTSGNHLRSEETCGLDLGCGCAQPIGNTFRVFLLHWQYKERNGFHNVTIKPTCGAFPVHDGPLDGDDALDGGAADREQRN